MNLRDALGGFGTAFNRAAQSAMARPAAPPVPSRMSAPAAPAPGTRLGRLASFLTSAEFGASIDRAYAIIDPRGAARRTRFRALQAAAENYRQAIVRAGGRGAFRYEAAQPRDAWSAWNTPGTSANAEIGPAAYAMRARTRDAARNFPIGRRIPRLHQVFIVGTGILPRIKTGKPSLDKKIMGKWFRWAGSTQFDVRGTQNYNAMCSTAAHSWSESGEVLAQLVWARKNDRRNLVVPLQVKLLEADHLDTSLHGAFGEKANGVANRVLYGVEVDANDAPVAYWVLPDHPGEAMFPGTFQPVRVPARNMVHLYEVLRPGQVRGEPFMAAVLKDIYDLDSYREARLMRARMAACMGIGIETPGGDEEERPMAADGSTAAEGALPGYENVGTFRPGMFFRTRPGEEIKKIDSPIDSDGPELSRETRELIAVGSDLTYHQVSGDLSRANYSSQRGGKLDHKAINAHLQWNVFIPRFCEPIFHAFIGAGALAGYWPADLEYTVEWGVPKYEYVDPLKDAEADKSLIRSGLATLRQKIAEQGWDPDEQFDEIAGTLALLKERGIVLDTDPSRVSATGKLLDASDGDEPDAPAAKAAGGRK
jgi:lambda family phage portal protein